MTNRKKIRWLVAHFPLHLFIRTAEVFRDEIEKLMPGRFDIEILTMRDYIAKYDEITEMRMSPPVIKGLEEREVGEMFTPVKKWIDLRTKWQAIFKGLNDGKLEMSQTQVTIIGNHLFSDFDTLDLPFLFDDHDHCTRVVDGEIGEELLHHLHKKTGIKGLSFTYSGGYRVVGSNYAIEDAAKLMEVPLATSTRQTTAFFSHVGANTVIRAQYGVEEYADLAAKRGAIETTYLRFTGKHVMKTNHSMFLTTIMAGGALWESLDQEERTAFKRAAKTVAKIERMWSIEEANQYERDAVEKGVTITELNETDRQKLISASHKTQRDADKTYSKGLVRRMLAANGKTLQ